MQRLEGTSHKRDLTRVTIYTLLLNVAMPKGRPLLGSKTSSIFLMLAFT